MTELLSDNSGASIAYFSMEIALEPGLRTYSGGLGVLAGDTLRAAADLKIPMAGVTLAHRKGYFRQHLDAEGNQSENPVRWPLEERLEALAPTVEVNLEGRPVRVRAWQHLVRGYSGYTVPVYLLDTDVAGNEEHHRRLTDHLYGGDDRYRLFQEAVLGLGGLAMLRALGHNRIQTFHMNEGHSALLGLGLLEDELRAAGAGPASEDALHDSVRQHCAFTTHTPVPAGHDQFPMDLVREVLGEARAETIAASGCCLDHSLNMTYLALHFSRFINGVAMRHSQVSRGMFPTYPVDSITNGVHAGTWVSRPFRRLFDRHFPEWRYQNPNLRYAVGIPLREIREAHEEAKRELLEEVRRRSGVALNPQALTIGFARRATPYKRADLLFADLDRLRRIARDVGPLQIIYAGKAHPRDQGGKDLIRRVFAAGAALRGTVPVVYLEDYDLTVAALLCSGVDLWLNTPQKPQEASGTSGMKAALNGVPSLSVLDGWWIEGHVEGVTGWSIGDAWEVDSDAGREAASLYEKLESVILPLHYGHPEGYDQVMRAAIALNGSFFNAERMVLQYAQNAYGLGPPVPAEVTDAPPPQPGPTGNVPAGA